MVKFREVCIRCPMPHVNPKMLARLTELETDLLDRRGRAETEGWVGEVEGIDLTLTFLRAKRNETQRRAHRPAVHLGIPTRLRPQESETFPRPVPGSDQLSPKDDAHTEQV
ncbi:hypothetical protein [Streptomyces sp. WG5]|uniref:hypothetical protein n=1 Tax=Streptomyces sp. WG5 TaxID=3417648 RepID=UPI003CF3B970